MRGASGPAPATEEAPAPEGSPVDRGWQIEVERESPDVCLGRDVLVHARLIPDPPEGVVVFRIGAATGNPAVIRAPRVGVKAIPVIAFVDGVEVASTTTQIEVLPCDDRERILLIARRLSGTQVMARVPLARGARVDERYRFDFGDGHIVETAERHAIHTYSEPLDGVSETRVLTATVLGVSGETLRARTQFMVMSDRARADHVSETARILAERRELAQSTGDDYVYEEDE